MLLVWFLFNRQFRKECLCASVHNIIDHLSRFLWSDLPIIVRRNPCERLHHSRLLFAMSVLVHLADITSLTACGGTNLKEGPSLSSKTGRGTSTCPMLGKIEISGWELGFGKHWHHTNVNQIQWDFIFGHMFAPCEAGRNIGSVVESKNLAN